MDGPADAEAEFDDPDTIGAIKTALESGGHLVELFEAEPDFPVRVAASRPDIVFNIAEGSAGRGREAQVPAILSFLRIPFVGSDETTMCIAMDKALTKRLLSSHGVSTPAFTVVGKDSLPGSGSAAAREFAGLPAFPVILKPVAEGSGKGITTDSVVTNAEGLSMAVGELASLYAQDILIEEFIEGREFTVGLLGNGQQTRVFAPMEVIFRDKSNSIYSFEIKRYFKQHIDYACPPDISADTRKCLEDTALKIYRILECRDFARIDFRLSSAGRVCFIEINPIPGLAPGYSDYPMLAEFCGIDYNTLVLSILDSALARYGLR